MFRDSSSSLTKLSGMSLLRLFTKVARAVLCECEGVEMYPAFPIKGPQTLTVALNPSAVDGTTINFSLSFYTGLCWSDFCAIG